MTQSTLDALWLSLGDLTREQLERGLRRFYRTREEIFPNTNLGAVIRKLALVDNLAFPTAAEAWEIVRKEICRVGGSYGKPSIQIAPVQKTVDVIGWQQICLSENPEAVRAHFFKAYEQLVKRSQDMAIENEVFGELSKRLKA